MSYGVVTMLNNLLLAWNSEACILMNSDGVAVEGRGRKGWRDGREGIYIYNYEDMNPVNIDGINLPLIDCSTLLTWLSIVGGMRASLPQLFVASLRCLKRAFLDWKTCLQYSHVISLISSSHFFYSLIAVRNSKKVKGIANTHLSSRTVTAWGCSWIIWVFPSLPLLKTWLVPFPSSPFCS